MMDLDELKTINDRHGHYIGDRVLGGVGEVIRSGVRKIDTAARYGGDEFVVLLPETDPTGAYVLAEKVRIGVTELDIAVSRERARGLDLRWRRQLSRRRPNERRAADQRRPGDVRLEARRQQPGHGLPDRGQRVDGRLGVASGHAGARFQAPSRGRARPTDRLLDAGDPGSPPRAAGRPAPDVGADLPDRHVLERRRRRAGRRPDRPATGLRVQPDRQPDGRRAGRRGRGARGRRGRLRPGVGHGGDPCRRGLARLGRRPHRGHARLVRDDAGTVQRHPGTARGHDGLSST